MNQLVVMWLHDCDECSLHVQASLNASVEVVPMAGSGCCIMYRMLVPVVGIVSLLV